MDWINGFKYVFLAVLFGAIMTTSMISIGTMERVSIIMASLIFSSFIYSLKKQNIKSVSLIIVGIFIGYQIVGMGLYMAKLDTKEGFKVASHETYENSAERMAVLLVFKGEPERYSISSMLGDIREDVSFIQSYSIPLKLYKFKRAYERMGISRYNEHAINIVETLSKHLGNGYDVYMAYSRGEPGLESTFNSSVANKGYQRLITVPVVLSEDRDYAAIVREVERLNFYHDNIQIKYLNPMFDSEKLAKGIINKVNEKSKLEKSDLGLIIIDLSIGKIKKDFDASSRNQEKLFMEMIKSKLMENGYEDRKIKYANFINEREGIEDRLIELQQYGVSDLFIIGINDIYNSVDQAYMVDKTIKKIVGVGEIKITYIEGWGLSNWLIDELEYNIRILSTKEWKP